MLQIRKTDSAGRSYCAERDLIVVLPAVLRETLIEVSDAVDDGGRASSLPSMLARELDVDHEDVADAARVLASVMSGVASRALLRGEGAAIVRGYSMEQRSGCAVIGLVFLKNILLRFVSMYGSAVFRHELDPNLREICSALEHLDRFQEPAGFWRRAVCKVKAIIAILRSPVIGTGLSWPSPVCSSSGPSTSRPTI